jgi:predicted small lipoprotein YifL
MSGGYRLALAAAVVAALGLAGCGRKGPLDLPPSDTAAPAATGAPGTSNAAPAASVFSTSSFLPGASSSSQAPAAPDTAQDTAAKIGFDAQGNPVAPAGPKKSFFLDPILQ